MLWAVAQISSYNPFLNKEICNCPIMHVESCWHVLGDGGGGIQVYIVVSNVFSKNNFFELVNYNIQVRPVSPFGSVGTVTGAVLGKQRRVKKASKSICMNTFYKMMIMFFLNDALVTFIDKTQASDPTKRESIFRWEPLKHTTHMVWILRRYISGCCYVGLLHDFVRFIEALGLLFKMYECLCWFWMNYFRTRIFRDGFRDFNFIISCIYYFSIYYINYFNLLY